MQTLERLLNLIETKPDLNEERVRLASLVRGMLTQMADTEDLTKACEFDLAEMEDLWGTSH